MIPNDGARSVAVTYWEGERGGKEDEKIYERGNLRVYRRNSSHGRDAAAAAAAADDGAADDDDDDYHDHDYNPNLLVSMTMAKGILLTGAWSLPWTSARMLDATTP
jgi:hypothetical protein